MILFLSLIFLLIISASVIYYMVESTKKITLLKKEMIDEFKIIK